MGNNMSQEESDDDNRWSNKALLEKCMNSQCYEVREFVRAAVSLNLGAQLVEHRCFVHLVNENMRQYSALHLACLFKNVKLVQLFVRRGWNVNSQTPRLHQRGFIPYKETPLHVLINGFGSNMNILDYLINHGADVTLTDDSLNTPLHIATQRSHVSAVRRLLQCPCNVNALNRSSRTPLMEACNKGSIEIVDMLLANGADHNIITNKQMAIHNSVRGRDKDIFKRLLEISDYECLSNCDSLLQLIIDSGYVDILKILLESTNHKEMLKETYRFPELSYSDDFEGDLPFIGRYEVICAVSYLLYRCLTLSRNCDKMLDLMLKSGLPVNCISEDCIPPLSLATVSYLDYSFHKSVIEKLVYHGADVNYPDAEAPEALINSCKNEDPCVMLLLLQNSDFATPDSVLNAYVRENDVSDIPSAIVKLFLELGLTPFALRLLSTYPHKDEISDYEVLSGDVSSLQQLSRTVLRHLSIKEIMKNESLPVSICNFLRYIPDPVESETN